MRTAERSNLNHSNKLVQQLADPRNYPGITFRKQGKVPGQSISRNYAFLADQGNQSNLFRLKLMIF